MSHEHDFWTGENEYQELAETFEKNIEIQHPSRVKGECSHLCGPCPWAATTVTYYEYSGPSVRGGV